MKQVAIFPTEHLGDLPVFLMAMPLQQSEDGNLLLPRGGNFLESNLVQKLYGTNFSQFLDDHTENDGLSQPNINHTFQIDGYRKVWLVDKIYKVHGWVYMKNECPIDFFNGSAEKRTFETEAAALNYLNEIKGEAPPLVKPPVIPTPSDAWKGVVGDWYPSTPSYMRDYFEMLAQMPGEHSFSFLGNPGVQYPAMSQNPEKEQGNHPGLSCVSFPTHSVTYGDVAVKQWRLTSFIEMEMHDMDGNLIWAMRDTKGGLHPKDTGDNTKRGNNHPWFATRWLKNQEYDVRIKNISTDYRANSMGFEFIVNGDWMIRSYGIVPGEERRFRINMVDSKGEQAIWAKLNGNLLE